MNDFKLGDKVWYVNDCKEFEQRIICNIEQAYSNAQSPSDTITLYYHRRPFMERINLIDIHRSQIYASKADAIDGMIQKLEGMKND